jgi:hypothetical protein
MHASVVWVLKAVEGTEWGERKERAITSLVGHGQSYPDGIHSMLQVA